MGGGDKGNANNVDITKTWCDIERTLEGLRPAVVTLMSGEGVQYESAAALIMERIRSVEGNCRVAREASEHLVTTGADDERPKRRRLGRDSVARRSRVSREEDGNGGRDAAGPEGEEDEGGEEQEEAVKEEEEDEEEEGAPWRLCHSEQNADADPGGNSEGEERPGGIEGEDEEGINEQELEDEERGKRRRRHDHGQG